MKPLELKSGMNNFWLNRRMWSLSLKPFNFEDTKYSRSSCSVLLESCRLQYEVGNDEEYAAYLKDFHDRTKRVLDH